MTPTPAPRRRTPAFRCSVRVVAQARRTSRDAPGATSSGVICVSAANGLRLQLTYEHIVFLENVLRIRKAGHHQACTLLELDVFVRKSRKTKFNVRGNAVALWQAVQNAASSGERRQLLTLAGAEYLVRTPENEGLAQELKLYDIAVAIITESQSGSDDRVLDALSNEDVLRSAASAQQHGQQVMDISFQDCDIASGFSHQIQEEYEEGLRQALLEDVLPRQIGRLTLTDGQLAILSKSNTNTSLKLSFRRFMSHYAVWKNIALKNITETLKLLHATQCEIDFNDLPTTSDGLLSISEDMIDRAPIRNIFEPIRVGRGEMLTARYLNLGIKNALLGISCGLIFRWEYLMTMRIVVSLFPEFVPPEIRQAIGPQKGEELDPEVLKHWFSLPSAPTEDPNNPRQLVLLIHGHIDGVQWLINSTQPKGVPILGRLVGIKEEVSGDKIKIPTLSPFVIGTLLPMRKKVNTKKFVKNFVEELAELNSPQRSGLSFKVQLVCMICDAPQRAECKGIIGHGGYYACERCIVKGKRVAGAVRYLKLNARLRTDAEWNSDAYVRPLY